MVMVIIITIIIIIIKTSKYISGYRVDDQRIVLRFLAGPRDHFLIHSVRTSNGLQAAAYLTVTSTVGKLSRSETGCLSRITIQVKNQRILLGPDATVTYTRHEGLNLKFGCP